MIGCSGFYPLNDGGGITARDISGNKRDGTLTLGAGNPDGYPVWSPGHSGRGGLQFSGFAPSGGNEGSYVVLNALNLDLVPVAGGTISCWARAIGTGPTSANSLSQQGVVTLQPDAGADGILRGKISGGANDSYHAWHVRFGGTSDRITILDLTTAPQDLSGWVHLIWQYDGTNQYGGYNGVIHTSGASSQANYITPGTPKIGKGDANNFNGEICDVRFWNRVLSADELFWLYDDPLEVYIPRRALYFFRKDQPRVPLAFHYAKDIILESHATPEIASHCDVAVDKLLQQFKKKPKIEDYICILADKVQEIEQVCADTLAFRSLDTAVGVQLDKLGQNLVILRNGYDDDKYRRFLKAKALRIGSLGRADQLIAILEALDNGFDDAAISFTPSPPAGCIMHCRVPAGHQLDGEAYAKLLKPAAPATVQLILEFEEADVTLFQWATSTDDPAPDGGSEWGEVDTVGGIWAEAV